MVPASAPFSEQCRGSHHAPVGALLSVLSSISAPET